MSIVIIIVPANLPVLPKHEEIILQEMSEKFAREREQEMIDRVSDMIEAEMYARLERPRQRRQAPLPTHHHKTWGHGNSHDMINMVGQFSHRPQSR